MNPSPTNFMEDLSSGLTELSLYPTPYVTHRVPHEIWENIFNALPPSYPYPHFINELSSHEHYSWTSILFVCHLFYDIAVRWCPALWSSIYLHSTISDTTAKLFLERSGQHKLLLVISGYSYFQDNRTYLRDLFRPAAIRDRVHTLILSSCAINDVVQILGRMRNSETLINRIGIPGADLRLADWPNLHTASFDISSVNTAKHLPPIARLIIGNTVYIRRFLHHQDIAEIIRTQTHLEELILIRVCMLRRPEPIVQHPYILQNLKRISFYSCDRATVEAVTALIERTPGLTIGIQN